MDGVGTHNTSCIMDQNETDKAPVDQNVSKQNNLCDDNKRNVTESDPVKVSVSQTTTSVLPLMTRKYSLHNTEFEAEQKSILIQGLCNADSSRIKVSRTEGANTNKLNLTISEQEAIIYSNTNE